MLKDHMLKRLMTLFLQNSFDFQKSATLKDLNRHLECTDVSFNPENDAFSKIKK